MDYRLRRALMAGVAFLGGALAVAGIFVGIGFMVFATEDICYLWYTFLSILVSMFGVMLMFLVEGE